MPKYRPIVAANGPQGEIRHCSGEVLYFSWSASDWGEAGFGRVRYGVNQCDLEHQPMSITIKGSRECHIKEIMGILHATHIGLFYVRAFSYFSEICT